MNAKDLIYSWSLPSRAGELRPYSLRIPSDTYAKFQALKQVFPGQSINDLIIDILNEAVRDIVESLETDEQLMENYQEALDAGLHPDELRPAQRDRFNWAYREALREMTAVKAEKETAE